MARETRSARPGSAGVGDAPSARLVPKGVFRREGEIRIVGYRGKSFPLKDSKGLGYLAHLLRHPGTEFHVLDLVGGIAGQRGGDESAQGLPRGDENLEKAGIHIGNLGDAGEMLDEQAKAAYRRRLSNLREELEEAKELGNVERAERAEAEIDALTRELSRAVGLGGRNRRAISDSERARQSVSKTIKAVVDRIAQSDAALADILSRCVKTGSFCSYEPDPEFPIAWEFAAATIEPTDRPVTDGDFASASSDRPKTGRAPLAVSPFSLAERTAFVGRESEVSAIRSVVDSALGGRGSIVMLGGGPGVGKTRLAMEMSEYASGKGFGCLVGHCYERDEPFPFLPFSEIIESSLARAGSLDDYRARLGDNAAELAQIAPILRRVFPDIPPPMDLPPAQQRRYLFQSFSEAVARGSRRRPQLSVLEDLHWADESSLRLLIHLANRVAQLPVVIIGTYRDVAKESNPPFVRTLEELIRMGVRPLKLDGLTHDAVAEMLNRLCQRQAPENLLNAVFEESQGNPFFVEEVYRHLVEEGKVFDTAGEFRTDIQIDEVDVPQNVRLCIIRRFNRFSADEMRVLGAAAVIGRSFSFQHLAAISGADVDELFATIEKAQRMAIIVPSAEGPERPFTFAHELLRQTLLGEISIARRQQLHSKAAWAVESLYPAFAREYAGEIADHLLKAGSFADQEAVVHWLIEAGNAALEASAFEEARANFEPALSRLEPNDSRRRAELLYGLGAAQRGVGRWEEAYDSWNEAFGIFTALNDHDRAGRTCLQLTEGAGWTSKRRDVFATAERFVAEASIVSSQRALLLAILALGKLDDDETDAAEAMFPTALALAEELPESGTEGAILAFRSQFNFLCLHLREALDDSLRSAELIDAAGPWNRAQQLLWYQATLLHLGRVREANKVGQELERLAIRIGHVPAWSLSHRTSAWVEFWQEPNLDQLEDELRRNFDPQIGSAEPFFVSALSAENLSNVKFLRGEWHDALRYAESAWSPQTPRHVQGMNVAMRFRAKVYSGDREGALKLLEDQHEMVARLGKTNTYGSWALLMAAIEGLYVLGEREKVAPLYPLARGLIDTGTICVLIISRFPQTIAGIAATAARNWEAAEGHFNIAMQQAQSFPNVLEGAEIRRFHAMMLLDRIGRGDREKAQTLLREAIETYTQIGMPRHIEMTRRLIN